MWNQGVWGPPWKLFFPFYFYFGQVEKKLVVMMGFIILYILYSWLWVIFRSCLPENKVVANKPQFKEEKESWATHSHKQTQQLDMWQQLKKTDSYYQDSYFLQTRLFHGLLTHHNQRQRGGSSGQSELHPLPTMYLRFQKCAFQFLFPSLSAETEFLPLVQSSLLL